VTTRGKGFEDVLVKQIEDATGLPATTSIRSAIRALAHLGVRNVAVVTPYPEELHQSALSFLAASGFRVVAGHTMDVVFKQLQDVTPRQIFTRYSRAACLFLQASGQFQAAAVDATQTAFRPTQRYSAVGSTVIGPSGNSL
jgi:maleate cis-trans isomerase